MKSDDKNGHEISKNHSIIIVLCVVALVIVLVGIKILLTE